MCIINEMRLDFPALPENESFARMVISGFMLPMNPTMEELADVKTAVSEAVTNAIIHGYGNGKGTIRMHALCMEDGTLLIDIIDRGKGSADIEHARQPFFTTSDGDERSGMGFTVMESFMDDVTVSSIKDEGTKIVMTKKINLPE